MSVMATNTAHAVIERSMADGKIELGGGTKIRVAWAANTEAYAMAVALLEAEKLIEMARAVVPHPNTDGKLWRDFMRRCDEWSEQ